jgi:hypothetical protein
MLSKLTAQRTKLWNKIQSQKKRSTCTCRPIMGSVDLFAVCFHSNGIYAKALQTVRNRSGKVPQFRQILYKIYKNAENLIRSKCTKNGRKMGRSCLMIHVFDLENHKCTMTFDTRGLHCNLKANCILIYEHIDRYTNPINTRAHWRHYWSNLCSHIVQYATLRCNNTLLSFMKCRNRDWVELYLYFPHLPE